MTNFEQLLSSSRQRELGCGERPTPGYIHNDINHFPGADIVGNPWEIDLPSDSLDEVLGLGMMEHLTYGQVALCFSNVRRMLRVGGTFYFDVPDIPIWCKYVVDFFSGKEIPFTIDHVFSTLYGWQRWAGDEHKSGWYDDRLKAALAEAGFTSYEFGVQHFLDKGIR